MTFVSRKSVKDPACRFSGLVGGALAALAGTWQAGRRWVVQEEPPQPVNHGGSCGAVVGIQSVEQTLLRQRLCPSTDGTRDGILQLQLR